MVVISWLIKSVRVWPWPCFVCSCLARNQCGVCQLPNVFIPNYAFRDRENDYETRGSSIGIAVKRFEASLWFLILCMWFFFPMWKRFAGYLLSKLPLVLFFVPNPLKFHNVYQPMGLNSTLCWTLSRHCSLETHLILGHFLKNFFNDSLPLIPFCFLASILIIQILAFPNWSSYFLIISLHSLSPCLFKLPLGRFLQLYLLIFQVRFSHFCCHMLSFPIHHFVLWIVF